MPKPQSLRHFITAMLWVLMCVPVNAEVIRQVFEWDKVSTAAIEYGISFSPDGQALYFTRSSGQWGKKNGTSTIYHSIKTGDQWSAPVVASFSGRYNDSGPHISADGTQLFFVSDRPSAQGNGSADIWVLSKGKAGEWHDLRRLSAPINSDQTEYSPRTTANGDLYFASDRVGGYGQGDLYVARRTEAGYGPVENLGPTINAATGEWNLAINAPGDVLIFEASGRPENQTVPGDLYISFKLDSAWSKPQNLVELNTPGSDLYPELIGEHTLYFASNDQLGSFAPKVYQVDFRQLLQRYRQQAKK